MNGISRTGNSVLASVVTLCSVGLGCASTTTVAPRQLVVYPPSPSTPRVQFLTSITTSHDLGARTSIWKRLVGVSEEENGKAIAKPYGLSIHQGKLYVCDTFINGLDIIDFESREFEFFQPTGGGLLLKPINCFMDAEGMLYVVDTQRQEVVVFDSAGTYAGTVGDVGVRPADVFVSGDRIWMTDLASGMVRVYDKSSRRELFAFPDGEPDGPGRLAAPANLYVTPLAVYVSDMFQGTVKVYSRDGTYLRNVGSMGTGFGQLARPKGVAVDRNENLYVVDAAFQNVQVFNPDGELLMYFGEPGAEPGSMTLPAKVVIDYDNLDYFRQFVHSEFDLQYLILVTNQYGPDKINIYGFVGPPEQLVTANNEPAR